jgi:GTP pyrophosphokinase
MVEMITAKGQSPSAYWEDIVVTGKAKAEITKFLRDKKIENNIQLGRNILERAFIAQNIQGMDQIIPSLAQKLGKTIDNLYLSLACGEIAAEDIIDLSNLKPKEPKSLFHFIKNKVSLKQDELSPISGLVAGVQISFAKCCNPIPGDNIVGVVYPSRGVTIHTGECQVCNQSAVEKIFNLNWNNANNNMLYISKIKIICEFENSIVLKIINHMTECNIHIINMQVKKIDQFFNDIICDVEVSNLAALNHLINLIKNEKAIYSIARAKI